MAGVRELLRRARRLATVPNEKETEVLEIFEAIDAQIKQDKRDGVSREDNSGPLSKEETERQQGKPEKKKRKPRPEVKWITKYVSEDDDDLLDPTFRKIHGYDKVNLRLVDLAAGKEYLFQKDRRKPRVRDHTDSGGFVLV